MPSIRQTLLVVLAFAVPVPQLQAGELAIANSQPLSFGSFVAGNGAVSVRPDGSRTSSGAVIMLESRPGQAAQFLVTGDPYLTFAVTLPNDGTVSMSNGSSNMPVNGFVSSPTAAGTLSVGGSQMLSVGARLEVTAGQMPGSYSGTFLVVVDYN